LDEVAGPLILAPSFNGLSVSSLLSSARSLTLMSNLRAIEVRVSPDLTVWTSRGPATVTTAPVTLSEVVLTVVVVGSAAG
jgi:hypothetical protein